MKNPVGSQVVFLHSTQPQIDRSWNPTSAVLALHSLGIHVSHETIDSEKAIFPLIAELSEKIFWPVTYTIGPDPHGPLLTDILRDLCIPHIGWPATSLQLNSKILMKEQLLKAGLMTPPYILPAQINTPGRTLSFPLVVKSEYSATSVGVMKVMNEAELGEAIRFNSVAYGQNSLIEEWRKCREYTVAVIGFKPAALFAPIEIITAHSSDIFAKTTKTTYEGVLFKLPSRTNQERLSSELEKLALVVDLGDYARVDIIEDDNGELFFIDFNFLPGLDACEGCLSLFPMALGMNYSISYLETIAMIVASALMRQELPVASALADPVARALKKATRQFSQATTASEQ